MSKKVIWKAVPGSEQYYQISNTQLVRSIPRVVKIKYVTHLGNSFTRITHFKSEILKARLDHYGYLVTTLHLPKIKVVKIHRLVAEAFVKGYSSNKMVNHKNGIKTDNRIENLEWVTDRENISHDRLSNKNKSSRFIGVYQKGKKWVAQIQINGIWKYLGFHEKESQAAKAYQTALIKNNLENKYSK